MGTKKVYICSPLRGDMEYNMAKAREYCRMVMKEENMIPVAPHISFTQFLDDTNTEDRELGIKAGLLLLSECDELWYFGTYITEGMRKEIDEAFRLGIPVRCVPVDDLSLCPLSHNSLTI